MSLYEKYLSVNLKDYDSFGGFDFYISVFLAAITCLLCVGVFISNHRKNTAVKIIKQLTRHGAKSEESAKTLSQIGIKDTLTTRRLLEVGTRLSRIITRVGTEEITPEEYLKIIKRKKRRSRKLEAAGEVNSSSLRIDFEETLFYIPEEKALDAHAILMKGTTSVWQNILISVFFVSIFFCLMFFLPEILDFLDDLLD